MSLVYMNSRELAEEAYELVNREEYNITDKGLAKAQVLATLALFKELEEKNVTVNVTVDGNGDSVEKERSWY